MRRKKKRYRPRLWEGTGSDRASRTLCAYTGLPSSTKVTSESSWLSSNERMSAMNEDDIELIAGDDMLVVASAAVCSL